MPGIEDIARAGTDPLMDTLEGAKNGAVATAKVFEQAIAETGKQAIDIGDKTMNGVIEEADELMQRGIDMLRRVVEAAVVAIPGGATDVKP